MHHRATRVFSGIAALAIGAAVLPTAPTAAHAVPESRAAAIAPRASSAPVFWSAILRLFVTLSKHATTQMAQRNISQTMVKNILNEGKVVARSGGVTRVRQGNYEVRVNSTTGNVITVVKVSGGGGSGGGW